MFVIYFIDSSPPSIMISLVSLSVLGSLFFISSKVFLISDVMIGGTSDASGLVF